MIAEVMFVLGNRLLLLQGWVPVAGGIQAKGMSQEEGKMRGTVRTGEISDLHYL